MARLWRSRVGVPWQLYLPVFLYWNKSLGPHRVMLQFLGWPWTSISRQLQDLLNNEAGISNLIASGVSKEKTFSASSGTLRSSSTDNGKSLFWERKSTISQGMRNKRGSWFGKQLPQSMDRKNNIFFLRISMDGEEREWAFLCPYDHTVHEMLSSIQIVIPQLWSSWPKQGTSQGLNFLVQMPVTRLSKASVDTVKQSSCKSIAPAMSDHQKYAKYLLSRENYI